MQTFTVSQFIEFLNAALTAAVFPSGVLVEGEVVEHRVSQGKWIWFKLKDEEATVSCFATVWQLRTPLEDGLAVRVFGYPKIHPKSGRFSLNVERAEPVGEGALRRAFELLKAKLAEEGLFAPERKRPLPRWPRRIGLITSREAAAYTDFLRILGNRWGGLDIELANVAVQGRDAVSQICAAFDLLERQAEPVDVIVLTRGGGSLEDLQAFNSEEVTRAVFGCRVPVVVGVGHERDETLADYAADVRAATPSNAAELLVPDRREMAAAVDGGLVRIRTALEAALERRVAAVQRLVSRLDAAITRQVTGLSRRLAELGRCFAVFAERQRHLSQAVAAKERLLRGLDPRRVLARGYALVRSRGRLVKSSREVDIGQPLDIQLSRGGLEAEVTRRTRPGRADH